MIDVSRLIEHPTIYLKDRGHFIDLHVLPICELLWSEGIETFYSCQGGPSSYTRNGKIWSTRAYVQILRKDAERACKLLKGLRPKIDDEPGCVHKDRVAIRFTPPEKAKRKAH